MAAELDVANPNLKVASGMSEVLWQVRNERPGIARPQASIATTTELSSGSRTTSLNGCPRIVAAPRQEIWLTFRDHYRTVIPRRETDELRGGARVKVTLRRNERQRSGQPKLDKL